MKCNFCGGESSSVVETRKLDGGSVIRRRRQCSSCEKRFTTYEKMRKSFPTVLKSGGGTEDFSREKLSKGVSKACEKRPIGEEGVKEIVDSVEAAIADKNVTTISSEEIGEIVMEKLKAVDQVAYVRFASVYRSFEDLNSFREELEELKTD